VSSKSRFRGLLHRRLIARGLIQLVTRCAPLGLTRWPRAQAQCSQPPATGRRPHTTRTAVRRLSETSPGNLRVLSAPHAGPGGARAAGLRLTAAAAAAHRDGRPSESSPRCHIGYSSAARWHATAAAAWVWTDGEATETRSAE
jgi:hypothetical protein